MHLTTHDLAQIAGISDQAVRDYEASGLLPPVSRRANGYRDYSTAHLAALILIRALKDAGYDRSEMTIVMQAIHANDLAPAIAILDAHHADEHARRIALAEARSATSRARDADHPEADGLSIGEAAKRLGTTKATMRFWEAQGLIAPKRAASSRYRRFDAVDMERIVTIQRLRAQGSSWAEIRAALDASDPPSRVDVAEGSTQVARATAMVWAYCAALHASDADAAFWSAITAMRAE